MDKPIFQKRLFWDVDYEMIDYEIDDQFVIERVFDRGDVDDIRECRKLYSTTRIKEVLLQTKFLRKHRLYLASAIINEPLNSFKCYTTHQLNQKHLPY